MLEFLPGWFERRNVSPLTGKHEQTYMSYRGWMLHIGTCSTCRSGVQCWIGENLRMTFYADEMAMRSKSKVEAEFELMELRPNARTKRIEAALRAGKDRAGSLQ